jgi:predicted adenine nucleotide alpha hydrolase (AANH) superfamily ATPase
MNYYQFNKEYISNTLNKYKSSIGAVEKANIKLIELYYDTTLTDYVNAVKGLKAE